MGFYDFRCDHCRILLIDVSCAMAQIRSQVCPECAGAMKQDFRNKVVTLDTDTRFGRYFNSQVGDNGAWQTRSDYKIWKAGLEAKGCIVGEGPTGVRRDTGQKMADEVTRHGPAAAKAHRLRWQQEHPENRGEKVLTPNQAARIEQRKRLAGQGQD